MFCILLESAEFVKAFSKVFFMVTAPPHLGHLFRLINVDRVPLQPQGHSTFTFG